MRAGIEAGKGFSSDSFERAELLAADFDGTTHDTFQPPPGGVDVDEAYRIGIERIFYFDSSALDRYKAQGGHANRTPWEIVHSLAPKSTPQGLQRLTEELVKEKLDLLSGQIGEPLEDGGMWPRPLPGFNNFWDRVQDEKDNGRHITTAILSSGHAPFIRRVFDVHGLAQPDIMVTDETIRGLNSSLPPEKLAKPAVMPMLLAKTQWLDLYGLDIFSDEVDGQVNRRITVFGDSLEKDGGLAANSGARFVHIDPERSAECYRELGGVLELGRTAVERVAVHEEQ